MLIEEPDARKAVQYCTRVIDKNVGIESDYIDDIDTIITTSNRAKAFFRRALALRSLGMGERAVSDLGRA